MPSERVMALIDLALTAPTRAADIADRWAEGTAETYAAAYAEAKSWCRSEGWTCMPMTPEVLALYASHLADQGFAPPTIRKAIAAIKAWHRLHGQPVPDGVPALAVLRDHETTLRAAGWEPKRTDPLPGPLVLEMLRQCDRSRPRGARDAAIVMLGYVALLTAEGLSRLTLGDVEPASGGVRIGTRVIRHWGDCDESGLCPVEVILAWRALVVQRGAPSGGPFLRLVDRHGHVAGVDERWAGVLPADGGGMQSAPLRTAVVGLLVAAGVQDVRRYGVLSLRLGGAVARRIAGASVTELADEDGRPARSAVLVDYVRAAEDWSAGGR